MSNQQKIYHRVRYIAAALALAAAIIYFMIGFKLISVIDDPAGQSFGIYAGSAYLLGTVLLSLPERRLLFILGAVLQVFVIYTYFSLAPLRSPSYEIWGVLLRIDQLALLISLAYLAWRTQGEANLPSASIFREEDYERAR